MSHVSSNSNKLLSSLLVSFNLIANLIVLIYWIIIFLCGGFISIINSGSNNADFSCGMGYLFLLVIVTILTFAVEFKDIKLIWLLPVVYTIASYGFVTPKFFSLISN